MRALMDRLADLSQDRSRNLLNGTIGVDHVIRSLRIKRVSVLKESGQLKGWVLTLEKGSALSGPHPGQRDFETWLQVDDSPAPAKGLDVGCLKNDTSAAGNYGARRV